MPKTAPRAKSDPFADLERDHRRVEQLFERVRAAKGADARERLFLEIKDALALHAVLEEHVLYPALRSLPDPEAQSGATSAYDAHEDVKGALSDLEMTPAASPAFLARVLTLADLVAAHVADEEERLFPRARKLLAGERLAALGRRMARARAEHEGAAPKRPAAARK
jgi:hemerythrin superfamily protein